MSEKEIAIHIDSDEANLLATPPQCVKWPPVRIANKQSDGNLPPVVSNCSPPGQISLSAVNGFGQLRHDSSYRWPPTAKRQYQVGGSVSIQPSNGGPTNVIPCLPNSDIT